MKAAILGTKVGMTRIFSADGNAIPVTVIQAGPCSILQVKTMDTDGYEAVQLGFLDKKPARCTRPEIGHARKANQKPKRFVREIRLTEASGKQAGDVVTVGIFEELEVGHVDIVGTTIGKGFQGTMKRHNFAGQEASHGVERKHRSPGSISGHGNRGLGRCVKKGKKMSGHMGHERVTSRNQKLVAVDKDRNLLLVKGGVPGPNGGYLVIAQAKAKK
ncbi:MAG: 50S ribosomal protein L3 [Phycisphaerales bacterium]|nr:50S ribosomal protein L3 [Phycisphaerales bacterium]MCB9854854.1 50S ribosomal protein L3 [Phycisphaerales bacterium]